MKTIYLAQMKWCEREDPICAGTSKRKVAVEALRLLKIEYGTRPVSRRRAACLHDEPRRLPRCHALDASSVSAGQLIMPTAGPNNTKFKI